MGDIKEARFTLTYPQKYNGKSFHCSGSNDQISPNSVKIETVTGQNYFIKEWTEWTSCNEANSSNTVIRSRTMANDTDVQQKRYCRCSDAKPLPSPR